jgi:hypothetical protein
VLVVSFFVSLFAWLVGEHLLLRDFGPYRIIFMNMCVIADVIMVMLLRDFEPCDIIFMTKCVYDFLNCPFPNWMKILLAVLELLHEYRKSGTIQWTLGRVENAPKNDERCQRMKYTINLCINYVTPDWFLLTICFMSETVFSFLSS